MSSNENDAFDTLMNEFTAVPEAPSGEDTAAPVDENPQEVPEEPVEGEDQNEAPEGAETDEGAEEGSEEEIEGTEEEEEAPPPKNKKSAQERINEVVAKRREVERELAAERAKNAEILRRLETLESGSKEDEHPSLPPAPAGAEFGLVEPTADDLDKDGEAKYPLGSFDPNFIRDLNRYDRAVERAYEAKIAKEAAAIQAQQTEEQKLFNEWNEKLTQAEKTSPNIREKAQELVDTFAGVDPNHIQTIAQTIMQLDNGPAVLEYLADNLDEADKLVKMSTNVAMLQLGRLDGYVTPERIPETPVLAKPTAAPRPPAALNRGSGGRRETASTLYDKMLKDFR